MPAPFPPAIGLIFATPWSSWVELSRSRINMGAIASREGFVLIETFAVKGVSIGDEVTMNSVVGLAERCSVRILLVAEDVPMALVAPIRRSGRMILNVVPSRLLARS